LLIRNLAPIVIVLAFGGVMKRKPKLEADLDPAGTRHTRPGSKIAESAVGNAKKPQQREATPALAAPTRPGSTAAARAVDATRRKASRK
jgi:hypothetical protein